VERFIAVIKTYQADGDLLTWAFGPLPWPIEQLLAEEKQTFDAQIKSYAIQRFDLILESLEKKQNYFTKAFETERMKLENLNKTKQK
jgi:hypothetical protein